MQVAANIRKYLDDIECNIRSNDFERQCTAIVQLEKVRVELAMLRHKVDFPSSIETLYTEISIKEIDDLEQRVYQLTMAAYEEVSRYGDDFVLAKIDEIAAKRGTCSLATHICRAFKGPFFNNRLPHLVKASSLTTAVGLEIYFNKAMLACSCELETVGYVPPRNAKTPASLPR